MIVERFICQVCLYGARGTVPGQLCGQSVHGGFGFDSPLRSTFEWECGAALAHTSSTSCPRVASRCILLLLSSGLARSLRSCTVSVRATASQISARRDDRCWHGARPRARGAAAAGGTGRAVFRRGQNFFCIQPARARGQHRTCTISRISEPNDRENADTADTGQSKQQGSKWPKPRRCRHCCRCRRCCCRWRCAR